MNLVFNIIASTGIIVFTSVLCGSLLAAFNAPEAGRIDFQAVPYLAHF